MDVMEDFRRIYRDLQEEILVYMNGKTCIHFPPSRSLADFYLLRRRGWRKATKAQFKFAYQHLQVPVWKNWKWQVKQAADWWLGHPSYRWWTK